MAVWMLNSYRRPELCQTAMDCCAACGMTSPLVVWIDESQEGYKDLRYPKNVVAVVCTGVWASYACGWNWMLSAYPHENVYGWISDDMQPISKDFDKKMEAAVGDWKFGYAWDNFVSKMSGGPADLKACRNVGGGMVWGGKLARAVGWLALPGTRQAGSDTAWTALARELKSFVFVDDVVINHVQWQASPPARPKDAADSWEHGGRNYVQEDLAVREVWGSDELQPTVDRVRRAMQRANYAV